MRQTIIGFFNNASDAEHAAERLRASGFSEADIDISTRHAESSSTGDYTSGEYNTRSNAEGPYNVSDESRYGEQRTSHHELNEDRIRDRKDDDSIGDSIGRFFRNLFDNKEEAERYATVGRRNSIVSVYAESGDQAERARDILDDCGAVDVDENAREYGSSYTESRDTERTTDFDTERRNTLSADGVTENSLPVIEENMNIGKREVESGGVRIRSRIVERPVEENLRLREEHVRVERVPVDRPATDRDFETFREGEVEMTETNEVPIVNKEARVVEEVRLKKDVNEREEVVRDKVRKTDVDVQNLKDETSKRTRTTRTDSDLDRDDV